MSQNVNCEHFFVIKNTWTTGWSGQYGTFICSKCLCVAKFTQKSKESQIVVKEIIPARYKTNE